MNISGATAAMKAFGQALNKNTVPEAQLLTRYRVCKTCPQRRKISGLASRLSKVLGTIANQNRVPQEFSKYKCNACNCSFMLLVPALKEDLHKDTPTQDKKRPAKCWVKTEALTPPTP
jgi:hypothetical protein